MAAEWTCFIIMRTVTGGITMTEDCVLVCLSAVPRISSSFSTSKTKVGQKFIFMINTKKSI